MSIIERIIIVLEHKGLTRADLARHLNKSTGQISMWEKRNTNPPSELISDIADFLDISVDYLLGREQTKKESTIIPSEGLNPKLHKITRLLETKDIPDEVIDFIYKALENYNK